MTALDLLGDWHRTHYAGDLRAADAEKEVVLMGWVHRRRDLGNLIFIDVRDRGGIAQIVFNKELGAAAHARAEELRAEYVVAIRGRVAAAAEAQSRSGQRRSGSLRLRAAHPEYRQDAAVRRRGRNQRQRGDAAALPLSRSAAPAPAAQSRAAPSRRARNAQDHGRAGLLRNRDAHPDALDARGRARLSGSQPRASRPVLRAAAIAANLQANSDDRRAWTAISRSPAASATRTCAPTASRNSRRSTWRCPSRASRTSSTSSRR